jgi:hypothetical protein
MNWAKGIVLSFILFILFIGTMVWIMLRQEIPLVSKDYYRMELNYQAQLNRKNNTSQLAQLPSITLLSEGALQITFPYPYAVEEVKVELLRPTSEKLDERHAFAAPADNRVRIRLHHRLPGACRVCIWWKMNGQEYYYEEVRVL